MRKRLSRLLWFQALAMLLVSGMPLVVSGGEVPEEISSQWKFDPKQVSLRWDSEGKTLTFRQGIKKVIIRGPSDLYRLPYRVAFESGMEESAVLLILSDGNPTHLTGKVIDQNETANPQVYVVNPVGVIVGK